VDFLFSHVRSYQKRFEIKILRGSFRKKDDDGKCQLVFLKLLWYWLINILPLKTKTKQNNNSNKKNNFICPIPLPGNRYSYIYIIMYIYNFCFPWPSTASSTSPNSVLSNRRVRLPESVRWVALHLDLLDSVQQGLQPTVFKAGFLMGK